MKYPRFSHHLIAILLSVIVTASSQAQQTAPQKYIIKPLNLGTNTEIRARSTRNLQVRVTDENDRPVPDAPVLFLLSSGGAGGGSTGSFAGQTSLRAMTNSEGIAQVDYTAGEVAGSKTNFKVQVEGTEAVWEGVLFIISALVEGSESKSESQPASQLVSPITPPPAPQFTVQAATQPEPTPTPQPIIQPEPKPVLQPVTQPIPAPNSIQIFNSPIIGHSPKSSVVRQTFTTTDGRKLTLQSMQGKVVVMHFFGVWCDTSKKQIQSIRGILARYSSEELEVIGMSVKDPRSTPEALRQFIIDLQITYAVVAGVEDKHFAKFIDSKNVSVPQTVIYGRDGRVIGHYLGFNPQVGAEIERIIKSEIAKQ